MNRTEKRTRVGIVGAGYVSSYHIRAAQGLGFVDVVGIADSDRKKAEEMASRFGIPNVYESLAEMQAARPDVIHILTPPSSHCALTLEALGMGCHVFVEKPMAESVEDCDRMMAEARRRCLSLSVNHSARMDPVILDAAEQVRNGVIGDIISVDFFRSSDYPPFQGGALPATYRKGSYPFADLGVHGMYLLETFLGEIDSIDIEYRSSGRDINLIFDEWHARAVCRNGIGRMHLSWNVRPVQNQLVIQGTRGVMTVNCFLQTCTVQRALPAPKVVQWILGAYLTSLKTLTGVTMNTLRFATKKLRPSPGIFAGVEQFHQALHEGRAAPVTPDEGRRMIALMEDVCRRADADRDAREERKPLPPARVLVTGAGGFLGRVLLRRLREQGEAVRVLVRRPTAALAEDPNLQVVAGDLGRPEIVDRAVAGVEVVYHVGAAMRGSPADFQSGTVCGTQNVVDACLRHGVKRLIYVSSLSVLDHAGQRSGKAIVESSRLEPHPDRRGAYTQTKLQAERIVLDAVESRRLPAVVLRPGMIFGNGAERVTPTGVIGLAGRWLVAGGGQLPLPLVYVDDVVDALLLAENPSLAPGSVFQIVDPERVTQREYIGWAGRRFGKDLRPVFVPAAILFTLAYGVELLGRVLGRPVPLTRYRIRSLPPLFPFDLSKASQGLGWKPRVGARRGLDLTFQAGRGNQQV
jgi:predicted dehydrogenase/nucleoside-diphosphate-sugar epimerase